MSERLDALIAARAAAAPGGIAIRFEGREISYAELDRQVRQTAALLRGPLGVEPGDRVATLSMNHPALLVLLIACARCCAVLVPLNWRLAPPEWSRTLADAGPGLLFHDCAFTAAARSLAGEHGCAVVDLESDGPEGLSARRAEQPDLPAAEQAGPEWPLMMVYTSGTTGHPKGAVLPQRVFAANIAMSRHAHAMRADDVVLALLPLFHVGGLNIQTLPALAVGAEVVLCRRVDPAEALQLLGDRRTTLALVVPTVLQALLAQPGWDSAELSALRALGIGSTDVPRGLIEAVHAQGVPVVQIYGATETGPIAIYQRVDEAIETVGSIGRAGSACEIRLLDERGEDVPPGEVGEIAVRGDNLFSHYWQNPSETSRALRDGWFLSGDLARRDADGLYWFVDRCKHVIISGGENVYPAELERVLGGLAGLSECAVVARPDTRWGAVPVVVAVRADPALDRDAVLAAFDGQLARYKHPREVHFVDALPRTALGKVALATLREQLVRATGPGHGSRP